MKVYSRARVLSVGKLRFFYCPFSFSGMICMALFVQWSLFHWHFIPFQYSLHHSLHRYLCQSSSSASATNHAPQARTAAPLSKHASPPALTAPLSTTADPTITTAVHRGVMPQIAAAGPVLQGRISSVRLERDALRMCPVLLLVSRRRHRRRMP